MYIETPGPIDRTPETPGSGNNNQGIEYITQIDQQQKHVESTLNIVDIVCTAFYETQEVVFLVFVSPYFM